GHSGWPSQVGVVKVEGRTARLASACCTSAVSRVVTLRAVGLGTGRRFSSTPADSSHLRMAALFSLSNSSLIRRQRRALISLSGTVREAEPVHSYHSSPP